MYVVTVIFEVDPERSEDFRAAVVAQARNSLAKEVRCRRFDVCFDTERQDRVFLYEIYDDADAFRSHLETDHFKAFNAAVQPWLRDKKVEIWSLAEAAG